MNPIALLFLFFGMILAAVCYVAYELRRSLSILLDVARQQHAGFVVQGEVLKRLMDLAEADRRGCP